MPFFTLFFSRIEGKVGEVFCLLSLENTDFNNVF